MGVIASLCGVDDFVGMEAFCKAKRTTKRDGKMTSQVRYYILSRKMRAKEFGQEVRGHWGLKTNLTRKAVGAPFFSVFNRISGKNQGPPDY